MDDNRLLNTDLAALQSYAEQKYRHDLGSPRRLAEEDRAAAPPSEAWSTA